MDAKSSVQNNKVIRIGGVLKWAEKRRPKLGRLFFVSHVSLFWRLGLHQWSMKITFYYTNHLLFWF